MIRVMEWYSLLFSGFLTLFIVESTSNIAATPPMGFSTWYGFGADINEEIVLKTAEVMVSSGLRDAGYTYVLLDDGWMAPQRDRYGSIYGHPEKFPSGMKALADKIHALGMKVGL
eukprot:gnl/MRDRNA2_/MRDRNA2_591617_c0_seq1.p1 gnl/MRDRNA2_/MRDRNA2_591617_c0~~gnl/MRDRNA2_/MRDRNA2_591617_c0_seq1.p1  ORF type:complete len:115 (+),score=15.29 gnl/MRDRNA2_/MRDRNA2_591617_c0_seq1:55-399(+)